MAKIKIYIEWDTSSRDLADFNISGDIAAFLSWLSKALEGRRDHILRGEFLGGLFAKYIFKIGLAEQMEPEESKEYF